MTGGWEYDIEPGTRQTTDGTKVSRYNINGWVEDLEDLNTGRWNHGCTRYTNIITGDKVNMGLILN